MLFNTRANVVLGMMVALSGLWLVSVPRLVSNSTFAVFAVFAVLFIGAVGVSYLARRDAQAAGTVGQLLYETELAPSSRRPASDGTRK
jgi:hypothetical protein